MKQALSLLLRTTIRKNPNILPNLRPSFKLYQSPKFTFCNEKNIKKQQPSKQQAPKQKPSLTELPFEELIRQGTEQATIMAHKRIADMEEQLVDLEKKVKELHDEMQFFKKHEKQLNEKEAVLMENLATQDQELQLVRKRTQKQIAQSKDFAVTKIAKEITQVADNIKRCDNLVNELFPQSDDPYIIKIKESKAKMFQMLANFEIEQFDPTGKTYDPNTQQSLLQIPCPPGYTANTVATTMRTGYKIKGRLLRSARVGIFS